MHLRGFPTDAGSSVFLAGNYTLTAADPLQPLVEVFPGALIPGTNTPVSVHLYNRGSAPMDIYTAQVIGSTNASVSNVSVHLQTPQGLLLDSEGILQADNGASGVVVNGYQYFFVTIPPNQSFMFDPISLFVPNTAVSTLNVVALVSTPTYNIPLANIPGGEGFTSSVALVTISSLPYYATSEPDQSYYDQGTTVTITGQTLSGGGAAVANATVTVHVVSNGYDRQISTVTDGSGDYTAVFYPLPNEAGVYNLSAAPPALVAPAVQSSFTIVGLAFQYSTFTVTMAQNSTVTFNVGLTNTGASVVAGLSASTANVSASGATLTLSSASLPSSLNAGAQASLALSLWAGPSSSSGTISLIVTDSHGFMRTLQIVTSIMPAEVFPSVTPQPFEIGLIGGQSQTQVFTLQNKGFDTWRGVTMSSPALSWVVLQGSSTIGDVPPGGNANFALDFEPPSNLPNGSYAENPLVQIFSINADTVALNVGITVTSSLQGGLGITMLNADHPLDSGGHGVPISSATVTLTSLDLPGLILTLGADFNGLAAWAAIPSGNYAWTAEAPGFQPQSGTIIVQPGLTQSFQIFMLTATVTFNWSVIPTSIADQYSVWLNLTFKTDVPAPIVIFNPAAISIPADAGTDTYGQFSVTNLGLVSAMNVQLLPNNADGAVIITLPFTTIPELHPNQTVVVPYKLHLVHSSCHPFSIGGLFHYTCAAGIPGQGTIQAITGAVGASCPVAELGWAEGTVGLGLAGVFIAANLPEIAVNAAIVLFIASNSCSSRCEVASDTLTSAPSVLLPGKVLFTRYCVWICEGGKVETGTFARVGGLPDTCEDLTPP